MKNTHPLWRLTPLCALFSIPNQALANTALWIGNPGVSATTNWSDNANWSNSSGGGPGYTNNDVVFGSAGSVGSAGTINNVADTSSPAFSLTYTNGPAQFHTTLIPAGVTLTNSNGLTIGGSAVDGYTTVVNMVGGGTLLQNGANVTVKNTGVNSQTENATLNLSGLSNFVYRGSSGTMVVAGSGSDARGGGNLILAGASNNITAGTINFNTGSGNSSSLASSIQFGGGTNILNVGTFIICGTKAAIGTVQFNGATGGLRLRGVGGNTNDTSRATVTLGDRNNTGGGNTTGTLSLNGHQVDIKVGTLTIGQDRSGSTSATHGGVGTVQFDTGSLDASTIVMAACTTADPGAPSATGTLTVGANGTLIVGSGGISMANQAHGTATGTLNINGGLAQVGGLIKKATAAGTATVNVTGGVLNMGSTTNVIGAVAIPIDNLNLTNATLIVPVQSGTASAVVTALTPGGAANTINVSSVPGTASFPAQFPVLTYTSLGGAFNFNLGTLPGTYQGYISNNTGGLSVDLVLTNSATKADVWNGFDGSIVNGNWDTTTQNWLYSGSPANYLQGDFVTFDDTLTGTVNVNLTTALAPGTIICDNSLSNYVFSGSGKISGGGSLTKQGSGSLTLTEIGGDDFSGGVTVNNGTLILDNTNSAISGGLTINGGTVQIGNNDGNGALPSGAVTDNGALIFNQASNATVAAAISGSGTLTQSGSGKLTLSGANGYLGNTTVSSGTLALSGSGAISSSAQVIVNNATFDVSALSLPATISSLNLTNSTNTVALNASGSARITTTSLTTGGTSNYINVTSIPTISSYPVTFTVIQAGGPIAGTFNIGVGSLPTASPPYAASVIQSGDLTAALITFTSGPTGVRPSVVWSGADVPNLNTNWSGRLNWQLPGAPTGPENVFFNSTAAAASSALSTPGGGSSALIFDNINNIVDGNFTVGSLTFTNLGGTYHNTLIRDGFTLNVTNSTSLTVGSGASAFGPGSTEFITISGPNGALIVNNTNGTLYVGLGDSGSGSHQATLDMSALGNFTASLSRFLVGVGGNSLGISTSRESGNVYLAQTNTITAGLAISGTETSDTSASAVAFGIGDNDGNGGSTSHLYLGQTNAIFADAIVVSRQKQSAQLFFNPVFTGPSAYFRGRNGTSAVTIWGVGDGVVNGGTVSATGIADLTGGTVNALVGTMYVGRSPNDTGGSGTVNGTLSFDAGTFKVATVWLGSQPAIGSKIGRGTINVNTNSTLGANGTLIVTGNLNIGFTSGGSGATSTSGTLNITNGAVLANNVVVGTNSSTAINLIGGRLVVTNTIGSSGGALSVLTLAPLGTPDNSSNLLQMAASPTPAVTVAALNLDGVDTTTNVINISSVARPISPPVELPLIQYTSMTLLSGAIFNVGLGTLPDGYSGYLTNDTANLLVGLVITAAPIAHPPVITAFTLQSGTNAVFNGTNGLANASYYVLSSPAVDVPLSTWTIIATNTFDGSGNFNFTNVIDPTQPQLFFALHVP